MDVVLRSPGRRRRGRRSWGGAGSHHEEAATAIAERSDFIVRSVARSGTPLGRWAAWRAGPRLAQTCSAIVSEKIDDPVRVAPFVVVPGDIFTMLPSMTMVQPESKMLECGLPTMSEDTIGSSVYSRMPFIGALGGGLASAALTSSTVTSRRQLDDQVDDRAVGHRHPHGHAVELALQLRA